uniref:Wiskott-Aldrich syndrome protein n=1 Tax=Anopheles farauti TaxID=69004 RepID=A0A182Q3W7_9DIPT
MKQPASGDAGDRNSTASKANRPSLLLTNEENDQLFRLLSRRCQTLSTAIVQLYTTQSPAHASWVKRCTGALCFIKDNLRKSYYFRLYCLKANQMVWEQELYEKIEVTQPKPYLITFEGQDGIVAFNFANEDEANGIMNTTLTTIHNRNRRRDERIKRNNTRKDPPPARPPPLQTIGGGAGGPGSTDLDMGVTYRNKQPFASPFAGPAGPAFQQPPVQALGGNHVQHQKPRKVKGMGKLQKSDIGSPSNFKHLTHVGWDPQSGFDLIGAQESLKPFLEKAGVRDQHLKDRDTCAFIYDFIQTNNVLDTVKSEQSSGRKQKPPAPPPVPVRTSCSTAPQAEKYPSEQQSHDSPQHTTQQHPPSVGTQQQQQQQNGQRNPPPPPPHRTLPPLPPTTPPKVGNAAPPAPRPPPMQPPMQAPSAAPAPPPPPPMPAGPMPPPPPPMMMPSLKPPAPAIPGGAGGAGGGGDGEGDARSALLDSIRKGTTLKKVDQSAHSTGSGGSGDARNDLMTEIQQGFQLRPVANRELNAVGDRNSGSGSGGDVGTDALADALRRALAERGRVIRPSDEDDSDSNSNNTDWED